MEDRDLLVPGETFVDGINDDDEDVPVRELTDFSIYDWDSLKFIPVENLLQISDGHLYGASGIVKRHVNESNVDEDEDEESDDGSSLGEFTHRSKLSKILEFNIHHLPEKSLELDPKIYIRTEFAWYILDVPSHNYLPFYVELWIKHRLVHLIVSASVDDVDTDYDEFVRFLKVTPDSPEEVTLAIDIIGRELTEADLLSDDAKAYVTATIDDLCEDSPQLRRAIYRVPLICSLRKATEDRVDSETATKGVIKAKAKAKRRLNDMEKDVLLHRNKTVVTPAVARIAHKLFVQTLRIAGESLQNDTAEDVSVATAEMHVHSTDPALIEWEKESQTVPNHFQRVRIDGALYCAGDIVIVEKGEDTNQVRERNAATEKARTSNSLANTKWFCKICYMYEKADTVKSKSKTETVRKKYFHAQWLQHGSQVLLQETAHSNGLFFINECDDLPLECIYQRCNLRLLRSNEDEPPDEPGSGTGGENDFHAGLTWDQDQSAFVEISPDVISCALRKCKRHKPCIACGIRCLHEDRAAWKKLTSEGISGHDVDYHVHDFVYLRSPSWQAELYDIAQIVGFDFGKHEKVSKVQVRSYGRYDTVARRQQNDDTEPPLQNDERRLFQTNVIADVDPSDIDGKAYVLASSQNNLEEWLSQDDTFFVDRFAETVDVNCLDDLHEVPGCLHQCKICLKQRRSEVKEQNRLLERWGPLRGLELFAGAGGLSTGLELSGFVETKWAVEFSPSAALTYSRNHPGAIIYNQCTNLLLRHAIDTAEGKEREPLKDLRPGDSAMSLPPMPKRGEVDFVYGGPPCQSFSMMNHHKKDDDVRNTLVCNMLAYVEFYRPSYFLLENVVGLLSYSLKGQASKQGVRMGIVKFVIRTLTCLGYQVHFKVLQAGQYGAPQGRRRVIFWGSKRDVPLPQFPIPTHCFPKPMHHFNLENGDSLHPATRANVDETSDRSDYHQCAPLPPITVNSAIGDLMTARDMEEAGIRMADGIPRFDAITSPEPVFPGFTTPVPYPQEPLNRYQEWIRRGAGTNVSYQYTRRFAARIVERVVNVPLHSGTGHADLPSRLKLDRLLRRKDSAYRDIYGRIDGDSFFATAMTTVAPNAKGGRLLHPNQKRIITVRECARAQGFPDTYEFLSTNVRPPDRIADQHRQIGNAVPVPLALALGKELGKALIKLYREKEAREAQDRTRSPELPVEI
ncbi:S-adenosyl-L-methionine-dependent methyltransferase [Sparassis latifolia]